MEKPTILLKNEFVKKITDDINNSNLPAFIIRLILQDILQQVLTLEKKETDLEESRYLDFLKQKKETQNKQKMEIAKKKTAS